MRMIMSHRTEGRLRFHRWMAGRLRQKTEARLHEALKNTRTCPHARIAGDKDLLRRGALPGERGVDDLLEAQDASQTGFI
jgi:hypothetical protein